MSDYYQQLAERVQQRFGTQITATHVEFSELTVELPREQLLAVCSALRDESDFAFEQLIDLCGVDYLEYGNGRRQGPRFAVVYHLLSVEHNHRIRLRIFADDEMPVVDSVISTWNSADWFEREAFDLYGIIFDGHPDLRRILTDYGFIGHPFRKDFPLCGNVEMIYDEEQKRVVYQPVTVELRTLVPRVIRDDHRYQQQTAEGGE
jgi:NADH-quinone oxidoreductase subunit C